MNIRKILVPLSGRHEGDDPGNLDRPALQAALHLARDHDAHVEALCMTGVLHGESSRWSAWLPGYGISNLLDWMEQQDRVRLVRARDTFERAVAACDPEPPQDAAPGAGYSAVMIEQTGEPAGVLGRFGRVSDLIVVAGTQSDPDMPFRPILDAALRETGRPLLVTPLEPQAVLGRRLAIAWNDSVEAARAVAAGLELAQRADEVFLICCQEDEDRPPEPDRLLDYLARHGVRARAVVLEAPARDAPAAVLDRACDAGCDLLVMGAAVHSRTHQLLFGSLTELVLRQPRLPALLAS